MNSEIKRLLESALNNDDEACLPRLKTLIQRHYPEKSPQRLWETDHSYYCSASSERVQTFLSWDEFLHGDTGSPLTPTGAEEDIDLNMVVRWDWRNREDALFINGLEDGQYELQLCYLNQRKGFYRATVITVTEEDEPSVRRWLLERYVHMLELWEPFFPNKDFKPWVPFFWDSNNYNGIMETPAKWHKCHRALQDHQTTDSILGAKMCPTVAEIPSFGYRLEHIRGTVTLGEWAKENHMYDRLFPKK